MKRISSRSSARRRAGVYRQGFFQADDFHRTRTAVLGGRLCLFALTITMLPFHQIVKHRSSPSATWN